MKPLLSFVLAALALLAVTGCATSFDVAQTTGAPDCRRQAQPGDTKINIYCHKAHSQSAAAQPASTATSCRHLADPSGKGVRSFCGNSTEWEQFDTWAANAGVTCRWLTTRTPRAYEELCLTAAAWQRTGAVQGYVPNPSGGFGGINDSLQTNNPANNTGNGSYTSFPAGTAIGAVNGAPPTR